MHGQAVRPPRNSSLCIGIIIIATAAAFSVLDFAEKGNDETGFSGRFGRKKGREYFRLLFPCSGHV
jgi:hypothetical protein